jgi:hypothetical protein
MEHRIPFKTGTPFDISSADYTGETASAATGQDEPWYGILANASPRDHIVQLYQDHGGGDEGGGSTSGIESSEFFRIDYTRKRYCEQVLDFSVYWAQVGSV